MSDLIKRLRTVQWSVTGEGNAHGNVDETCASDAADRIEQLERELVVAIEVVAESGRKRGEAEAKLAKAVEIGNKMAASIKGNYYIPNVVAEWNAVLAELEGKDE